MPWEKAGYQGYVEPARPPLTPPASITAAPVKCMLAEAQKLCAVESDARLGEVGVPAKVMVKDQPVFLCCEMCEKEAQADADKTLAKVKELKAKAAKPPK